MYKAAIGRALGYLSETAGDIGIKAIHAGDFLEAKITKRNVLAGASRAISIVVTGGTLLSILGCGKDYSGLTDMQVINYYFNYRVEHPGISLFSSEKHYIELKIPGYGKIVQERSSNRKGTTSVDYLPLTVTMYEGDRAIFANSPATIVIDKKEGGYIRQENGVYPIASPDFIKVSGWDLSKGWKDPTITQKKEIERMLGKLLNEARKAAIREL